MSSKTDDLRDLYLDVAGQETVTEPKEEEPSHDPVERREATIEREVSALVNHDGLEDAVENPTGGN